MQRSDKVDLVGLREKFGSRTFRLPQYKKIPNNETIKEALIKFHGCPSGARASLSFQILTAGLKSRPFKVPTCAELP